MNPKYPMTAALVAAVLATTACQQTAAPQNAAPATHTATAETAHAAPVTAAFKGTVRGYGYAVHTFTAKKGQHILARLNAKNAEVALYGYDDFVPGERFTIPADGEYELRVLLPRSFARRGVVEPYTLELEIR